MKPIIRVAHDFVCPWCWVGLLQVRALREEFPVAFEWQGYELWPPELEFPEPGPATASHPDRPPVPSRLDFVCLLDQVEIPAIERPKRIRTTAALQAVEFAGEVGQKTAVLEAIYEAFWLRGESIHEPETLKVILSTTGVDPTGLDEVIRSGTYRNRIIGFDAPAYASGVFNVPTFFIGGQRYAEQPRVVLRKAIREFVEEK
jgi:predicted DsbA family dithiol-disulfide isomerase